jgi:FkbM family methyltransferase
VLPVPLTRTLRFILQHPLTRGARCRALSRFLRWQIASRVIRQPIAVPFTAAARLLVSAGMTGATGNVYCGLHEFEEMAFVAHALRPGDLFADVGANVGTYTVLAAAVAGARCVAVEPIPTAYQHLLDNVFLNRVGERVTAHLCAAGRERGVLRFTSALDTMNHAVAAGEAAGTVEVPVYPLDDILGGERPGVLKIDVEGFETEVVAGAGQTLAHPALRAVVMELNGSGRRYGYSEDALHGQMLVHGFVPCAYAPFRRTLRPLSERPHQAGNALYVREPGRLSGRLKDAPPLIVNGTQI